jgi:hypothetical protein
LTELSKSVHTLHRTDQAHSYDLGGVQLPYPSNKKGLIEISHYSSDYHVIKPGLGPTVTYHGGVQKLTVGMVMAYVAHCTLAKRDLLTCLLIHVAQ